MPNLAHAKGVCLLYDVRNAFMPQRERASMKAFRAKEPHTTMNHWKMILCPENESAVLLHRNVTHSSKRYRTYLGSDSSFTIRTARFFSPRKIVDTFFGKAVPLCAIRPFSQQEPTTDPPHVLCFLQSRVRGTQERGKKRKPHPKHFG